MRRRPVPFRSLVIALGLNPLQGFVRPLLPEGPCGNAKRAVARPPVASSILPGARPHLTSGRLWMSVGEAGEEQEEEGATGESDDVDADGDERASMVDMIIKNDPGVLAATGISGALVGWSLVHPLDIGLDLLGAVTGCLAAVGLLGQGGEVGKVTSSVGKFVLGAFDVVSVVATSTDVPSKVATTVGEEFLEVVEFASGAVTKGYLDSLPEPNVRLEAEIAASKATVSDLKEQLEKVTLALSEAKASLAERAENKRIVDAAKSTAAQLARAKADLIEKNAEIAKSLQVARREKEVFDRNLAAAKAETLRFRQMVESRSDMDDNFKALASASDTLEKRVQEYEGRLLVLTQENESIRSDYSAEIASMEAERSTMRERISGLEASLSGAESRLDSQRVELEKELSRMGDALDERTAEVEAAERLAADMKAAAASSAADSAKAVEVAAAEAARRAAQEEKERSAIEVRAVREQIAAANKAAAAEKAAVAAEMRVKEQKQRERQEIIQQEMADNRRKVEMASAQKEEMADANRRKVEMAAAKEKADAVIVAQKKEAAAAAAPAAAAKPKVSPAGQQPQKVQPGGDEARTPTALKTRATATKAKAAVKGKKPAATAARVAAGSPAKAKVAAGKGGAGAGGGLMQETVKELRERCKAAGVPTTGRKADLVERLS